MLVVSAAGFRVRDCQHGTSGFNSPSLAAQLCLISDHFCQPQPAATSLHPDDAGRSESGRRRIRRDPTLDQSYELHDMRRGRRAGRQRRVAWPYDPRDDWGVGLGDGARASCSCAAAVTKPTAAMHMPGGRGEPNTPPVFLAASPSPSPSPAFKMFTFHTGESVVHVLYYGAYEDIRLRDACLWGADVATIPSVWSQGEILEPLSRETVWIACRVSELTRKAVGCKSHCKSPCRGWPGPARAGKGRRRSSQCL